MIQHRARLLEMLWDEQPKLFVHGSGSLCIDNTGLDGVEEAWPLGPDVLSWIAETLPEGASTLETGCGYSTMLFMICGAYHIAIAPDYQQHGRIVRWCGEHAVSCANLKLVNQRSQDALPSLKIPPLDLVLIDGCHAFPAPYMDWYYTAEHVKAEGYVIIDDCHLVTGRVLADFLDAEQGRWTRAKTFGKTVVFRKLTSGPVIQGYEWIDQPYCARPFGAVSHASWPRRIGSALLRFRRKS